MARVNPDTPMGLLAEQPLEGQIALLRTLEQASDDSLGRAALLYEIGAIIEEKQADESLAIREYLAAFNSAPQFRPPLYALIRIFERRRSFQNLLKLYEAEANSAVTAREKASALVDSAVLLEDHLNQSDLGRAMFEEAAALDPSLQATWLMLERSAWRLGDKEGAERAVLALSEHVEDPSWHAVLRVESAVALNQHGRVDEAIQLLRLSAKHEGAQSLYWQQLEAIAREHGRPRVLIDALEQQAKYWGSSNQSEGGTGAPSAEMVAALWAEAARYRSRYDNNADPMLESFGHAVAELPNDVALMLDMSVRLSGTPHQQEALLYLDAIKEQHPPAPLLGALSVLEGEILEDLGRHALAQQALERAVAACPDSRAAALLLENHIRKHHTPEARIDHLLNQSATHADHSFRMRWEAAQIAAHELGDAAKSRVLHQSAASVATESTAVLRELYGHLLRLGDLYAAREVATTLLRHELEDVERSALLRDQYELLRDVFGDLDATQELLTEILKVPAAADWAPDAARVFAAMNDNSQLCGMAHETLASRSSDPRLAAAHYCASARSYVRAENQSAAVHALRQSLLKVPHHSYATALIQHLVQTGERSRDLIALFRETAFDSGEPNGLESSLLLTAFEAELNQDYQTAIQTYLQLHQLSPHGVAASWHLRRLALRLGRRELLQQGLEGLYSREESQQRPGLATLELAEFRDLVSRDPEAASPLLASLLHHPDFGPTAAIMVLTQPLGAGQLEHRLAAVSRILPKTGGVAHIGLQREWISLSLASLGEQNLGVFSQAVETLIQRDPRDFYGHLMRLRTYSDEAGTASLRADGLMDIARATTDTRVAADLMLHAVRTKLLSEARDAQGDAVIYAHEIDAEADPMAAAVAFNETLGGGDDPQTRSDAFQTWTHHAGPEWSASARAALGRTLATAGRYADAVQVLGDVLTQDETDLSSWEALQHAARHAGMWRAAARACDVLSEHATGSLKTQLLEESALIWLNELEDENAAELRFVHALDLDPSREVAYEQYYRLLRTRGDTLRLLDLLKIRLTAVTNDKERGRLYYEQALLFRSIGNLEGCKEAVLHMLESEPAHVGGLALLAETLTVLEQWDSAIVVLRQLAQAQVPASQQRLCRLAAANILERKKRDP
ncbi:MAG: hypothetical protein H6715_06875, partial [Myxococcales bacterium]|nr:hypothetical protein [Myxococcales bacterium]